MLQVIPPPNDDQNSIRRVIADAIRQNAFSRLVSFADGAKETTNIEQLSQMLWEAITEGEMHFASGFTLNLIDEPKLWLEIVKFVATHLDGAAGLNANFNGINVFKVYQGIDVDQV